MKSQILTFILILFSVNVFSQERGNITGKFFITNMDIVVQEFSLINNDTINKKFIARKNTKFTAYESKNNKLLVKFWNYKNSTEQNVEANNNGGKYISNETNDKYFLIDLADFNNKTSE